MWASRLSILRGHALVGHAGGLDNHKALVPVDAGDIAPGKSHKIVFRQQQIRLADLFFQFLYLSIN